MPRIGPPGLLLLLVGCAASGPALRPTATEEPDEPIESTESIEPTEPQAPARSPTRDRPGELLTCAEAGFLLQVPAGWTRDPATAARRGMLLALHPTGEAWVGARAVMLVRCEAGPWPVGALVLRDKDRYARRSALVVTGEADPARTATGQPITLRTFSNAQDGRSEAVAYVEVEGGVVRLILRADEKPHFQTALPAFEALLGSFRLSD